MLSCRPCLWLGKLYRECEALTFVNLSRFFLLILAEVPPTACQAKGMVGMTASLQDQ